MKLLTYQKDSHTSYGALTGSGVIDMATAVTQYNESLAVQFPRSLLGLLQAGDASLATARAAIALAERTDGTPLLDPEQLTFLPPIPRPGKVICLGRNYAAHAREGGSEPPPYPMLFYKPSTSLLGHGGTIVIPPVTQKVDYEGELAVIIGMTCKAVSEAEAMAHVAGYAVANDVSARDLQRRTSQFTSGKMLDTFGPIGPTLVTADEIDEPGNLRIRTTLNSRVMQDDTTANMIFNIPFTISYISQIATLEPGDIILTGTPEGVGFPRNPPVFLQAGDEIRIEIEGVGELVNGVANQS